MHRTAAVFGAIVLGAICAGSVAADPLTPPEYMKAMKFVPADAHVAYGPAPQQAAPVVPNDSTPVDNK